MSKEARVMTFVPLLLCITKTADSCMQNTEAVYILPRDWAITVARKEETLCCIWSKTQEKIAENQHFLE